jgi:hypothetical protein
VRSLFSLDAARAAAAARIRDGLPYASAHMIVGKTLCLGTGRSRRAKHGTLR